jgi:hypothetical protein
MNEPATNRISPTDYAAFAAQEISARIKADSATGKVRNIRSRMEKAGTHLKAHAFVLQLRKMDSDEAAILLREINRYAKALGLDCVKQGDLFAATDDAPPSETAKREWSEAQAYEEGYNIGRHGRAFDDSRFPAGSPLHQRAFQGWSDAQAALAEILGREPEAGEVLKPEKRQAKPKGASVSTGKPRGRGARGGRRNASASL